MLCRRTFEEYGEPIGPPMQYFERSFDGRERAQKVLSRLVAINGWDALGRLEAEWSREFSPDSFYPRILETLVHTPLRTSLTNNVMTPWSLESEEHKELLVRVNLFPDEPLYSIVSDGIILGSFNIWPTAWNRGFPPRDVRFS